MCKAAHEAGGPQRCSGDARASFERSTADVSALDRVEQALRIEADESLFEPLTSTSGHTLQILKTKWYGVRTFGAHCTGCDGFVTPQGGFTSPADAREWAQAFAESECQPDPATLVGIGPKEAYSSMSPAEADQINRERAAGVHKPLVIPTRYRGLQTWMVFCPGCDRSLGPAGGYGQAGAALQHADAGCPLGLIPGTVLLALGVHHSPVLCLLWSSMFKFRGGRPGLSRRAAFHHCDEGRSTTPNVDVCEVIHRLGIFAAGCQFSAEN